MVQRLIALFLLVWLAVASGGPALAQEQNWFLRKWRSSPLPSPARNPWNHLGEKIGQEILERLKADGFTPVSQEDLHKELSQLKEPVNDAQAQEIGRKLGADMAIWGTLLKVGDLLSLEGQAPGSQRPERGHHPEGSRERDSSPYPASAVRWPRN